MPNIIRSQEPSNMADSLIVYHILDRATTEGLLEAGGRIDEIKTNMEDAITTYINGSTEAEKESAKISAINKYMEVYNTGSNSIIEADDFLNSHPGFRVYAKEESEKVGIGSAQMIFEDELLRAQRIARGETPYVSDSDFSESSSVSRSNSPSQSRSHVNRLENTSSNSQYTGR